jgi:hypothetical protein
MNQAELVDNILHELDREGILEDLIIVGSWCIHFYKHHYKEAESLLSLKTTDIDIDVNLLRKNINPVNIIDILEKLDFEARFHEDGSIVLINPLLKIEFLVPEIGRGDDKPIKIQGFQITACSLRWLDILEHEVITVNYKGLKVKVPHPARFAIHKLIISQRRMGKKTEKPEKDIRQAVDVINMLSFMEEGEKVLELARTLTVKQRKLTKKALDTVKSEIFKPSSESELIKKLMESL